jgi:hypothetical protein
MYDHTCTYHLEVMVSSSHGFFKSWFLEVMVSSIYHIEVIVSYIYIYIYIYICIHAYVTWKSLFLPHPCVDPPRETHPCTEFSLRPCMLDTLPVYEFVCMYVCMYVCVCVCISELHT